MIILCEYCGKEMAATKYSIYPGTNDTVYSIEPCYPSEGVRDILHDLDDIINEIKTARDMLEDDLEDLSTNMDLNKEIVSSFSAPIKDLDDLLPSEEN